MPFHPFVYLASQSPRRAQLLDQLGVQHRLLPPAPGEDVEVLEDALGGELPEAYVRRVTLLKLFAAQRRLELLGLPKAPILTADTTVALGRRILGKPRDADDAAAMLRALSGRTHRVLTAVAVGSGFTNEMRLSLSRVRFAELSDLRIRNYVEGGEPMGKAGAYAIQGRASAWVERIEGSYTGIMGLPLFETTQLLARANVLLRI
ncbi:putative septum formation protein [Rubrivivax sp. A210]|uniref:Maf family protein n=1 Tax=Rubrivivax sp. A210 TaxID=2772301 RepID=UPI0019188D5D|nr:Maf family protein [Rubrivivax sp. A210]CAD5372028.1 putative septum formation protein [Rubrivivax sp. A210]